jgi:hypothetical protein
MRKSTAIVEHKMDTAAKMGSLARIMGRLLSIGLLVVAAAIGFAVFAYVSTSIIDMQTIEDYADLEQEIRQALPEYTSYEDVTDYLQKRGLNIRWSEEDRTILADRKLEAFFSAHHYIVTIQFDEHKRLLSIRYTHFQWGL